MFPPSDSPRVFYLPPGVDFAKGVVTGLATRLASSAPEEWARLRLVGNSGRMIVRLKEEFGAGPPRLLPQMSLVTDVTTLSLGRLAIQEPQQSTLRRRLDLARLLRQPGLLANSASALDLASSLASLFDEMDEEGVTLEKLRSLDVSGETAQWQISLRVLETVGPFASAQGEGEAGRSLTEALIENWQTSPPSDPIIIVGSTGSRGVTALLIQAVSKLPQGALILPGFDPNTPQSVWRQLIDEPQEDHPQSRYAKLMNELGLEPSDIMSWHDVAPPASARNEVLSLALRPAPVTHHWLRDGPKLLDPSQAMCRVSLIEASDQRQESNAIALRLREAADAGKTAALISPDRMLTRRVSAALARWDIVPDDSAGSPLSQTAPGRLLRQVAGLATKEVTTHSLIALLKHPLVATGAGKRGQHLLLTRALEMKLRRKGPPFPTPLDIEEWANEDPSRKVWGAWLAALMKPTECKNLPGFCRWIQQTAEAFSSGPEKEGSGDLWEEAAGRAAQRLLQDLREEVEDGDEFDAAEATQILSKLLAATPMNIENITHPGIMIWGTLDARAQGAELVILGGLNEQTWPQLPTPDPWLNRTMRAELGLRSPERQVGLSAHDFQQAAAAPELWLTRATKSDDAETVPSRWLNRLSTLLEGLPAQSGPEALKKMRDRGKVYLDQADRLDVAERSEPAKRPSPKPPVAVRPKRLTVTEIKTLIRDPYAVYARHVLKLRELDPLIAEPDALMRGTVLHKVMQSLFSDGWPEDPDAAREALSEHAERVLNREVPWPAARAMWKARLMRVADWFIETERDRKASGRFEVAEASGDVTLDAIDFKIAGTADRIDVDDQARAIIYDYKTGTPPSKKEQAVFDKQLLLEAAMLERGAFDSVSADRVARAAYIGLGSNPKEIDAPLGETDIWAEFTKLILRMLSPEHGFTSRRAMQTEAEEGRYDHLARFGEWTAADDPSEIDL